MPNIAGCPGFIAFTYTMPARHSATACTIAPAMVEGAVAPAIPAESNNTGMPPRIHASITSHASVANFIGGTTKQLLFDMNGRSRNASSPPAMSYISSKIPGIKDGSVKLDPMCFEVPDVAP